MVEGKTYQKKSLYFWYQKHLKRKKEIEKNMDVLHISWAIIVRVDE